MTQDERDAHFYRLVCGLRPRPGDTLILSRDRVVFANDFVQAIFRRPMIEAAPEPTGPRRT